MNVRFIFSKIWEKIFHLPIVKSCRKHKTSKILHGCNLNHVEIGRYTYVGGYTKINNCKIGSFCSIAGKVSVGGSAHCMDFVSTSPLFNEGRNIFRKHFANLEFQTNQQTIIGNDVWIGEGAYIKGGVKIGNGAVIGMGSVVTHDVGAYEVWAGVPAKKIRKRFDDETCKILENSHWWTFEEKTLLHYAKYFNNPQRLIEEVEKGDA